MSFANAPSTVRSISTLHSAIASSAWTIGWLVLALVVPKAHVVAAIFAVLFVAMTWRIWNVGIKIEDDGVRVVGLLLSRRVPWGDIDRFAVLPLGGYPYVGHVVLRDGHSFGTYGIGAPGRPRRERFRLQVQEPVDRLNEALAEWREAHRQQQPAAR